jgi:hypothetical protein
MPGRIYLVSGWYQQCVSLAAPQHSETLPAFHPIQERAGLLM